MNTATDLSCLSWEPCILKHVPGYDRPWDSDNTVNMENPRSVKRKRIPVYVEDLVTGQVTLYQSYVEAGVACGVPGPNIQRAVEKQFITKKKYRCYRKE